MNNKTQEKKNKKWFNCVVIAAVLLIPFMYSFFYLKAYWDPYGHIEDIPVAIVNEDKKVDGESKGEDLINGLEKKKALDISVTDSKKATEGLNNKEYYAVITIPSDFTSNLLSGKEEEKKVATITYSPNQKTNYLASQIISRVVLEAEKEVRSEVSKEVVTTLTNNLNEVPKKVEKIDDGLELISSGTNELKNGTKKLEDGSKTLSTSYNEFNNGVINIEKGTKTLSESMNNLDLGISKIESGINTLADQTMKLEELKTGINTLKTAEDELDTGLNAYIKMVSLITNHPEYLNLTIASVKPAICTEQSPMYDYTSCNLLNTVDENLTLATLINQIGTNLSTGNAKIKNGVDTLNTNTSKLEELKTGITTLKTGTNNLKIASTKLTLGTNTLYSGAKTLKESSQEVLTGINTLTTGTTTLATGANTLNNGVLTAKNEVSSSIKSTNKDIKKLNSLSDFTANPIKVKEKDINKVNEYGTAFSPFFMSIALWVGSLMLFIILYYDQSDRFKLCSKNAKNKVKRTLCYLALAASQGIILGILLKVGLGFKVTNYFLYFISMILVACTFEAIMEFLIVNFNDVGKFIALILLVLQLAAAGGTFPIQTVSIGFQKLFKFLPMKYTIDLFKESLISIEGALLSKSIIVIALIFIFFVIINFIKDMKDQKLND